VTAGGEPAIVREARAAFVRWASVSGVLFTLNVATGRHIPSWSLGISGMLAAFWLVPRYVRLWNAGYSWRDVLERPVAPDGVEARAGGGAGRALPPASADEFGGQSGVVQQARSDRRAILAILDKVPGSERKLLPDVAATVEALLKRAEDLARMLHSMSGGVDQGAIGRIEEKVAATARQPEGAERERQLTLLQRQRQALVDLFNRRRQVEEQLESCGLAMQNVRFDLLRLRSAGVAAVLGDITSATQQARALSRDVDHAIAAAGEIREALGGAPPPGP
jgi:hypothetical protein